MKIIDKFIRFCVMFSDIMAELLGVDSRDAKDCFAKLIWYSVLFCLSVFLLSMEA